MGLERWGRSLASWGSSSSMENVTIEEEDGTKGLILCGGGDLLGGCEVGKELLHFGDAHVFGVTFVVKENVVFDPADVGVFGTGGVVFDTKCIAILVEEFFTVSIGCGGLGHFCLSGKIALLVYSMVYKF